MKLKTSLPWSTAAVALLALSACNGDDEPQTTECDEPLYAGGATDEAWRTLLDARNQPQDSSRAVTLMSPESGQAYWTDQSAPVWQWTSPLRASLERPGRTVPALEGHPRESKRSVLAWLGNLVLPTAEAHLPPYTGDLYWVKVFAQGRECPIAQVLTSELQWQLDDGSWRTLKDSAGKALSVQVVSAYLVQNRITEGPYSLGAAVPITMGAAR
ncbi:hypothetical protein [Corallococcus aberystwythensis]|uniref:Lipoprotein n=1 Tax=Corallococcus aberystwythensis TaxID=2316722 RepID=A0A3A8QMP8_9BACT|nr:hypothetical protein [Corallococcus aberystwythensis]RKH70026.1 hypothetical protein D7W81_10130 [Corallococcus aberystwythensis]